MPLTPETWAQAKKKVAPPVSQPAAWTQWMDEQEIQPPQPTPSQPVQPIPSAKPITTPPAFDTPSYIQQVEAKAGVPVEAKDAEAIDRTAEQIRAHPEIAQLPHGEWVESTFLKLLEYGLYPITAVGMALQAGSEVPPDVATKTTPEMTLEQMPGYVPSLTEKAFDIKDWIPGGEKYNEYQALPWHQQMLYEAPAWALLALLPAATGLSAKLEAAARAGRVARPIATAGQVALTPILGYEWVVGKVISATIGGTYRTVMTSVLKRNLRSWAKSVGVEIPKATEDVFIRQALASLKPQFMAKEAVRTLFKPTKGGYTVTQAGAKAAEQAANQAVRTSPLLLGKTPTTTTGLTPATVTGVQSTVPEAVAPTTAALGWETTTGVTPEAPTTAMAEGETVSGKVTDVAQIQEIKNSIAEGEMILKSGRSVTGRKMSPEELGAVQRSVDKARAKIEPAIPAEVLAEYPDLVPPEGIQVPEVGIAPKPAMPAIEPETQFIPENLPPTPPPVTPAGTALGRSDNEWDGFMADLQNAETVADIAFRNDMVRKWANTLPGQRGLFSILNPQVVANTPSKKSSVIRSTLRDEGYQKTQGVMAYLNELGVQENIFGGLDSKGLIKSGVLKGQAVGDIAQQRPKWEAKLTDEQKFWLDRADAIEQSVTKFLQRNGIDINLLHLEEGGQFATRRVWGKTLDDNTVIDVAYVGAGPGRPGSRLPTEKARFFKTEAEAVEAGYRYIPYEEALYMKVSGAYNRVADKEMADWLLTKVTWRTTGAPEELVLAAEAANLQKRHSQMLLAGLNRVVRGERLPDATIRAIAVSYPDQAQQLKDLIPRIQAAKPSAKEINNLTNVAKGLVDTNRLEYLRAVAARARAREAALTVKYGEAVIPAPAFSGKILTGPEAKETARTLRESFEPSFSKALGEVNKANAVARYFMLAGDFSPFTIQLIFLMGENPKIYGKAFAGAVRAMVDPKFQAKFLSKHKATIDRHPNLLISKGGGTEFTEAMARGGWLSGKTSFHPDAEAYWKSLSLFLPRAVGKVGATVLTPFQRVFESSLDSAGIYMAEAYEHLATSPENIADIDQFINEFRGLTSSARIGISGKQRQLETMAILAPRYNRAIAGLLFDLSRGNIRGHLARKALIKGIAALSALAVAISIARGEDEEEILDHFNPNSSNFFTWDVAGQKIGPGSKVRSLIKLIAQASANPEDLLEFSMDNPALRFVRGNLSPTSGSSIDLITGRSYIGDPTRDGILSFSKEILAGNLLPIWVQSVLMEGGSPGGRTARGLAEFFGGRAYPEPLWNEVARLRDKYAQQDYRIKYEGLNRAQVDKLRENHPDLGELEEKARVEGAERGSEFEQAFYTLREETIKARDDALEDAAILVLDGTISKYDYDKERGYARPYYSGGMSILYGLRDILDPKAVDDIQKWIADNQKPEDKALDEYQEYRASVIEKADLPRDWDDIQAKCDKFLAKYDKGIQDYVKRNLNRWINDLPENAKQVELMRLEGIENETWWDDYRGESEGQAAWQQGGEAEYPWRQGTTPQTSWKQEATAAYPWRE